jgi:hypothetical protein
VAFHFKDSGVAIAEIDNASVFPWAANDLRSRSWQFGQPNAGGLVGAMLGPHDRENSEFGQIWSAAQALDDQRVFIWREAMFGNDGVCDRVGDF